MSKRQTICVAGASGFAGSHIVREALLRGYHVRGTLQSPGQGQKTSALMRFPGAERRLRLFAAKAEEPGAFDQALEGCSAVFLTCFPPPRSGLDGTPTTRLDRRRGWEEIIRPAEEGCLNILTSASCQGLGTAVLCSSTASAEPAEPSPQKQEYRDRSEAALQIAQGKYQQAQKTVMEEAANRIAKKNGMRLVTLLPSMMIGPALMPHHLEGHVLKFLSGLLHGLPGWHDQMPAGSMSLTHPQDLAQAALAACEDPLAARRYFAHSGSWSWQEIYDRIAQHVPLSALPGPGETGCIAAATRFDFTRRDRLQTRFRNLEEIIGGFYKWLNSDAGNFCQL